jgi:hypothetical protein
MFLRVAATSLHFGRGGRDFYLDWCPSTEGYPVDAGEYLVTAKKI